jgi:hypothetical protein
MASDDVASNRSICQAILSVGKRLTEAGYPATGPDAVPFQSCALKFSKQLMEHGEAVQVAPIKPTVKAPGTIRLRLKYGELLSTFAFKSNLRRYNTA